MAEAVLVPALAASAKFLAEKATSAAIDYFCLQVSLVTEANNKVTDIEGKLKTIKSILMSADRKAGNNDAVAKWVKEVRDVSFKVMNILDNHTYDILYHPETSPRVLSTVKRCMKPLRSLATFRRTSKELDSIQASVKKIMDVYNESLKEVIPRLLLNDQCSQTTGEPFSGGEKPRAPTYRFRDDDDFLSSNGGVTPKDLEESILKVPPDSAHTSDGGCSVIAVCGMPGVGKTTLVQKVFHSLAMKFRYAVWVTVGQSPDIKDVEHRLFRKMVENVNKSTISDSGNNKHDVDIDGTDGQLLDGVAKELNEKECLIVFDDIWDAEFSRQFEYLFRKDRNPSSRLLITTRDRNVALSFAPESRVIELRPLQEREAWRLFCMKAFRHEHKQMCPGILKSCAEKIVKKCEGLPLAIVAAGGMMSRKGGDIETWERSCSTMMSDLGNDSMHSILTDSYYALGPHLKPCFLYCGTYPEDFEFAKNDMIRLWVAEGLVEDKKNGMTLEEEAEGYLKELVQRNLLQVTERAQSGEIISYRMHDVIRNMALTLSSDQRFSVQLDGNEMESNVNDAHRLSVLPNEKQFPRKTNLASLRSFSLFSRSDLITANFSSLNFKLLKVLMLRGSPISSFPDEILSLYLLRYLNLSNTKIRVEEIPRKIKRLRHLQTFELWKTKIKRLPRTIVKLKQLRHLMFDGSYSRGFEAPDGIWDLEHLQTLKHVKASKDLVERIGRLRELRTLWISKVEQTQGQSLLNSLGCTPALRELTIRMANGCSIDLQILDNAPRHLQFLSLNGGLPRIPTWFEALTKLKQLHLNNTRLEEDPFRILGSLPSLAGLYMNNAYVGSKLTASSFPKLKVLLISDLLRLTSINIATSALPELLKLQISRCVLLERPVSLAINLEKLEEFTLEGFDSIAAVDFEKLRMRSSKLTLKLKNNTDFIVRQIVPLPSNISRWPTIVRRRQNK